MNECIPLPTRLPSIQNFNILIKIDKQKCETECPKVVVLVFDKLVVLLSNKSTTALIPPVLMKCLRNVVARLLKVLDPSFDSFIFPLALSSSSFFPFLEFIFSSFSKAGFNKASIICKRYEVRINLLGELSNVFDHHS